MKGPRTPVASTARIAVAGRFLLLGEPVSLDLVNTRARRRGEGVDLLDSPAALGAWLRAERGRVAWTGAVGAPDLRAVRTLRDAIGNLLRAARERTKPPVADLRTVNRALAAPTPRARMAWTAAGPRLIAPADRSQRDVLLRRLAADATEVLTGPDLKRLRKCAHPDCVLQFIARNARRRWCSGALCGNRTRVARHSERQRQAR